MVAWVGPLATIIRESGQAWKGAATAVDLCAGVWLVQVAALLLFFYAFYEISAKIFVIVVLPSSENVPF